MLSIIMLINFATEALKHRDQIINNSVFLCLSGIKLHFNLALA